MTEKTFAARAGYLRQQVRFDGCRHRYTSGDQRMLSVTQVIKIAAKFGIVGDPFPEAVINREVVQQARERGQRVHRVTAEIDSETTSSKRPESADDGYIEAWLNVAKQFSALLPNGWLLIEEPLGCPTLGYAGTPDRLSLSPTGRLVVVDLKTGNGGRPPRSWRIQTAAYAALFGDRPALDSMRYGVLLRADGTFVLEQAAGAGSCADLTVWRRCLDKARAAMSRQERGIPIDQQVESATMADSAIAY